MDTIRFSIEECVDEEFGFYFPIISIYINDVSLLDRVEQAERGHRTPLRSTEITGQSYVGLNPEYHRAYRDEFLGSTGCPVNFLLTCACWEELCGSIVAKATMDSDKVVWSGIRNPFLCAEMAVWNELGDPDVPDGYPSDYSGLGPFVFDRQQYLMALDEIALGR